MPNETTRQIAEGVSVAMQSREMARTFRSKVGTALQTKDRWFGGSNIELYAYNGYHAEEMSVISGLEEGYRGKDFPRLAEVFQDAGHKEVEIFPACALHCWGVMYAFTHPGIEIVVADVEGKVHYEARLNQILHPPYPGEVYPSLKIREIKPLNNFEPLGDRQPWQTSFSMKHSEDIESVTDVALEYCKRGITFAPVQQLVFDGVAFGMKNKDIQGGFFLQTYNYKGYRPEETGGLLALKKGHNNTDFEFMVGVLPTWVEKTDAKPFLAQMFNSWGTVVDFAHPQIRITAVQHDRSKVFEGTLADIYSNFSENNGLLERLKISRRRNSSDPSNSLNT